jgi:hypothetical protein
VAIPVSGTGAKGQYNLNNGRVEMKFLGQQINRLLRLEVGTDEATGLQYLGNLRSKWQGNRDGDHPQAHDQPAKAGG